MKKVLKNKKGFTLVELLAVIVVLAVIMVIATQTVTGVLAKNTAKAFISSVDMAVKQAKVVYASEGSVSMNESSSDYLGNSLDYSTDEYTISVSGDSVCLEPTDTGKFKKMEKTDVDDVKDSTHTTTYDANDVLTKICKNYK